MKKDELESYIKRLANSYARQFVMNRRIETERDGPIVVFDGSIERDGRRVKKVMKALIEDGVIYQLKCEYALNEDKFLEYLNLFMEPTQVKVRDAKGEKEFDHLSVGELLHFYYNFEDYEVIRREKIMWGQPYVEYFVTSKEIKRAEEEAILDRWYESAMAHKDNLVECLKDSGKVEAAEALTASSVTLSHSDQMSLGRSSLMVTPERRGESVVDFLVDLENRVSEKVSQIQSEVERLSNGKDALVSLLAAVKEAYSGEERPFEKLAEDYETDIVDYMKGHRQEIIDKARSK